MSRAAVAKSKQVRGGPPSALNALFTSFEKLAEQAAEGRPLLRGLRVARDPSAHRFVAVHAGARVEFLLCPAAGSAPEQARVECRSMDSAGVCAASPIAHFTYDAQGTIAASSVPELVGERVDQSSGAWSVVAAVLWGNLNAA
jgi:hypothetical protein